MKILSLFLIIIGVFTLPYGLVLIGLGVYLLVQESQRKQKIQEADKLRLHEEERRKRSAALAVALSQSADSISRAYKDFMETLNGDRYVNSKRWMSLQETHRAALDLILRIDGEILEKCPFDLAQKAHLRQLRSIASDPEKFIGQRNSKWVEEEIAEFASWFDSIESHPLTEQQRRATVIDEDANLVVAGAGTGKTSTVVSKVGYILRKGYAHPGEILVLAFAKKAQEELQQRIEERFAVQLPVMTFHSLGLSIIGQAENRKPSLDALAEQEAKLESFIEVCIDETFADAELRTSVEAFFAYYLFPFKTAFDFDDLTSYIEYLKSHDLKTLKNERVKGFGELCVANFLFLNGIDYEYEAPYRAEDTASEEKRQYKPDFFLPGNDLYIEHFGIDRKGGTAPHINASTYRQGMEWKRSVHERNETTLIETYHYELSEGKLLSELKKKLLKSGVQFTPIGVDELKNHLETLGEIRRLTVLIKTFLNLFKSQSQDLPSLVDKSRSLPDRRRTQTFLTLFEAVYSRYSAHLERNASIDFHDMIRIATEHVREKRYLSPFKYIIVDEFQDISALRSELIHEMLSNGSDTRLSCVGDDWQSIYRFAGSDVRFMTEFGEHFGNFARVDLDTTFRFNSGILGASNRFVMANENQLKKELKSFHSVEFPPIHIMSVNADEKSWAPVHRSLGRIFEKSDNAEVLILARYRHLLAELPKDLQDWFPSLRITMMTAHASKGLEADYVIAVGLVSGKYGFPTEIVDDPILEILFPGSAGGMNDEERRLFYVTMTRARHEVFLITDRSSPSKFIGELSEGRDYHQWVEIEPTDETIPTCRVCGAPLVERKTENGRFWGCSNYPYCSGRGVTCPSCEIGVLALKGSTGHCNNPSCDHVAEICPLPGCGGFLLPKTGRFGPFWGCSNFPDCSHTRDRVEIPPKPFH